MTNPTGPPASTHKNFLATQFLPTYIYTTCSSHTCASSTCVLFHSRKSLSGPPAHADALFLAAQLWQPPPSQNSTGAPSHFSSNQQPHALQQQQQPHAIQQQQQQRQRQLQQQRTSQQQQQLIQGNNKGDDPIYVGWHSLLWPIHRSQGGMMALLVGCARLRCWSSFWAMVFAAGTIARSKK